MLWPYWGIAQTAVKVVFAHTLTLYLLVSKVISRIDILEGYCVLLATFLNFSVSKHLTFENWNIFW